MISQDAPTGMPHILTIPRIRRRAGGMLGPPGWAIALLLAMVCRAKSEEAKAPAVPGLAVGELLVSDDLSRGTGNWTAELEAGGKVEAAGGELTIDVPAGATLWFKPVIEGPVLIEYEATVVNHGGPNDRVSDLNCFWMARDSRSPADIFGWKRSGKFTDYNQLLTYYAGVGGNTNTTTRFRRYVGDPTVRPLRATDDLRDAADLLVANTPQTIVLVADGNLIQFYRDGKKLFEMEDPQPYTSGWFAFRTTHSHLVIRDFRVYRLVKGNGPAGH
jgi:hypothetical protein